MTLALSSTAHAQVLIEYAAGTNTTLSGLETASSVASGITGSTITGVNTTLNSLGGTSPNNALEEEFTIAGDAQTTLSESTTVTNGTYFYLTITANAGEEFSLSSLSLNAAASNSSERAFYVLDSADNYVQSNTLLSDYNNVTSGVTGGTLATSISSSVAYDVSLTGSQYQDLTSITLKIYEATGTDNQNVQFNDLILDGTVFAVPEPSIVYLLTLGGGMAAAFGLWRRTRWNQAAA